MAIPRYTFFPEVLLHDFMLLGVRGNGFQKMMVVMGTWREG